jgi:hypothetical protein
MREDISSRYVPYKPYIRKIRRRGRGAISGRNPQPVWPSVNPDKGVRVALVEVLTMPDAKYFAGKAQRCRELLKLARVPEVIEQLRVWATEFEAEAQNSAQRQQRKRGSSSMLRQRTRA